MGSEMCIRDSARAGEIKNFTGIDSDYETPENPEIEIDTTAMTAEEAADSIIDYMTERGFFNVGE